MSAKLKKNNFEQGDQAQFTQLSSGIEEGDAYSHLEPKFKKISVNYLLEK